ncbi:hemicentin-1 [Babesia caballi]|uniref:Hemicentin-1 n=1 Tax=Babesia caballi TaxID=5871 RepID=A0AAV4LN80_BABCB|nr:hemicentin-1 [Babesia caballi]
MHVAGVPALNRIARPELVLFRRCTSMPTARRPPTGFLALWGAEVQLDAPLHGLHAAVLVRVVRVAVLLQVADGVLELLQLLLGVLLAMPLGGLDAIVYGVEDLHVLSHLLYPSVDSGCDFDLRQRVRRLVSSDIVALPYIRSDGGMLAQDVLHLGVEVQVVEVVLALRGVWLRVLRSTAGIRPHARHLAISIHMPPSHTPLKRASRWRRVGCAGSRRLL